MRNVNHRDTKARRRTEEESGLPENNLRASLWLCVSVIDMRQPPIVHNVRLLASRTSNRLPASAGCAHVLLSATS